MFSANKIVILFSVDLLCFLLYYIFGITQMTEGRKYLPQGPHVFSPLSEIIFVSKNSVLPHIFFVAWTMRLLIFRETAAIYSQNHKKAMKTLSVKMQSVCYGN